VRGVRPRLGGSQEKHGAFTSFGVLAATPQVRLGSVGPYSWRYSYALQLHIRRVRVVAPGRRGYGAGRVGKMALPRRGRVHRGS
jgi:hypothetical protein